MKKTLIMIAGILLVFACKKDDPQPAVETVKAFEDIAYADIQKLEPVMKSEAFIARTQENIVLKAGAVLIYKTKAGVFGKMKLNTSIQNPDYLLDFQLVNYNSDGSVLKTDNDNVIQSPLIFNLDAGILAPENDNTTWDFVFIEGDLEFERWITPQNGCKFYIYSN